MRFRRFSLTAVTAVAALTLAACGGGGDSAAPAEDVSFEAGTTMARLAEAGTINVGTKFDQPLFGLQGLSGEPEGFDVEIAKIIAAGMGISEDQINWVEAPSTTREEIIEQGRVDMVVATYTINDARKERITFAGPYYEAGQTLMVRSDNTDITGPDAIGDARVCSVSGSTPSQTILEYVDQAQLTLFDTYSLCADALRTNQVDVVTTDNVILLGFVNDSDGAFKLAGDTFTEEPYGIGIARGDTAFCEYINTTLAAAAEDGSYEEAWTSTAGAVEEEVPTLAEPDPCS